MTVASRRLLARVVLLVLGGLALAAPAAPSEARAGLPLTAWGLAAAALVVYAGVALPATGRRTARWLGLGFGLAIGLKLFAAASAPPLGLQATYFATATARGQAERSTDSPWLGQATRIDPTLDLRGDQFPVHFFNDAARFNFGPDAQPPRDQLPFSVRWQGWLLVASDGPRGLVLEANGPASAELDQRALGMGESQVDLAAGLHRLVIDYSRPEASVPFLRLSWQRHPGGPLEPAGAPDLRWQPSAAGADFSASLGRAADLLLVLVLAAWLVGGGLRARTAVALGRAALGLVPIAFLVYGMLLLAPLAGRTSILSGLDDWLVYESSARDILLNGPLMDGGQGHAPPFYGQPLYPYVLAAAHRLAGESLFGPLAMQFAALGGVLVGTAVLARRAFGASIDGLAALAFMAVLVQLEPEHFKVARQLFNENLYMPLVMASLVLVVGLARRRHPPTWWQAILAGALLGLTAISRSQFLLFVPFGMLVLLVAWRRNGVLPVTAIGLGLALAIAPITARNWVVSGQLVPISSSGGASLLEFHRPPPGLIDQAALQHDRLFDALHLDNQTRTVLAFIRADPQGYLATLLPLGAHSIGLAGRNDPGVYWPLFATCLLYVASFARRATRRLHVWPVHAFVATHLLVLMLFEADTYGYRLVVPMYAPMAAVAAQVPLGLIRRVLRSRVATSVRSPSAARAERFGQLGWGALVAAALAWQARGLVDVWADRDTALVGLGGQAAHAAALADRVGANTIYVASVDGTPRRFGAGSLPGLRYPWLKWFDPARSLPLPPPATTAVYQLSELNGHAVAGDLVGCLGRPDTDGNLVVASADARQRCLASLVADSPLDARFGDVAHVQALLAPAAQAAGETLETRLVWQPLVAHPEPQQVSLQLDDPSTGDGMLWGNGTLELYPAREWQPGETILSRLPVATDATAIPQRYRLTLGIGPIRPNAAIERVPVAMLTLTPGSPEGAQAVPADMRPVEGQPLIGGGLQLIAAQPLPDEVATGSPLRIGLLWRAVQDHPSATELRLKLVRDGGEVVQAALLPLLGGRLAPTALRLGNVVRDEQTVVIGARVPPEQLSIEAELPDAGGDDPVVRLGSIKVTGRSHVFDDGSASGAPEAVFGGAMQLLHHQVARDAAGLTLKLRWRGAAPMQQAYKVFVHVLDAAGQQVIAQRDAEPLDGKAPTTSWLGGELVDDEYAVALPASLPSGDYPLEIGVYDPRTGERLTLADGENRLLIAAAVHIP